MQHPITGPSCSHDLSCSVQVTTENTQAAAIFMNLVEVGMLEKQFGRTIVEKCMWEAAKSLKGLCGPGTNVVELRKYHIALIVKGIIDRNRLAMTMDRASSILRSAFRMNGMDISPYLNTHISTVAGLSGIDQMNDLLIFGNGNSGNDGNLEKELEIAVNHCEFELFYQPKINIQTGALVGAEALVRWKNPRRGIVSPEAFIKAAARCGRLKEITWSVLNMAMQQSGRWKVNAMPLTVSVNMSPTVLEDEYLVDRVADAIRFWGVKPERLIFEITESEIFEATDSVMDTVRAFRAMGIGVSIDDFGTGYASLVSLKNVPATEIKIDRSFVSDMENNASDQLIIRNVVELGRSFGLQVVAEGIESENSLHMLADIGVGYGQGYLIGRPVPGYELEKIINCVNKRGSRVNNLALS